METPRAKEKVQREHPGTVPLNDLVSIICLCTLSSYCLYLQHVCVQLTWGQCVSLCPAVNEASIFCEGGKSMSSIHTPIHIHTRNTVFTPLEHVTGPFGPWLDTHFLATTHTLTHIYSHPTVDTHTQSMQHLYKSNLKPRLTCPAHINTSNFLFDSVNTSKLTFSSKGFYLWNVYT